MGAPAGRQRILRVTVRGRFGELSSQALEYLRSNQEEHAVHKSAYTAEGTLTYDSRIDFFSMRFEVRSPEGAPDAVAADSALDQAELFLRTMGFAHRELRASVADMATVWPGHEHDVRMNGLT